MSNTVSVFISSSSLSSPIFQGSDEPSRAMKYVWRFSMRPSSSLIE